MATLPISKVVVDQNDIYNELRKRLALRGTWKDLLPTNVGSTFLDMASGAATVNQFYVNTAFREAFLPTAVRDSSIYASTRSLGVKIARKTPAGVQVSLTNNLASLKLIPPYSEFIVGSTRFFNREQLMLAPGQTIESVNLYQGYVQLATYDLDVIGVQEMQTVILSQPGFNVSETDMLVYVQDKVSNEATVWNATDNALFELGATDKVYYDFTLGNGDVAFLFGTGEYGARLPTNSYLQIRFVITQGETNVGIAGDRVRLAAAPEVNGYTTTNVSGGGNEKSALYYKMFAPKMARVKKRVVSASEWRAEICDYPGVADCAILAQRDIAPNDPTWQNVVRVCVLPQLRDTWGGANPNPKSAQWTQFLQWLQSRVGAHLQIQTWNAEKVFVKLALTIYVFESADLEETRIVALERVLKLFQKRPGILGRRLARTDIEKACIIEDVDYVEIASPTEENIIPGNKMRYIVLDGTPNINVVYSERKKNDVGVF